MADSRFNREKLKDLNEQHTKVLKSLMARPENKKCADCRRKDPRWASWNLGVFVCIQCSGVHRSIGTHISKVKSADLDTWTPEQIENMVRWGNERANLYWEHAWPKDSTPSEKSIDNFIRAKYERKQYAKSMDVPDPTTLGGASVNDNILVESKPSSIPAVKVASASQSTFNAFGQTNTQAATTAATSSASQQLFDAFSAPAPDPVQTQKSVKDSIMSMYASSPSNAKPAVPSPQQSNFGDFATFQQAPQQSTSNFAFASAAPTAVPPAKFDPFNSLGEIKPTTSSNQTFDAFGSLNISAPASAAKTVAPTAKPVVNLLDDFEPVQSVPQAKKEDSFGDFAGKASAPLATTFPTPNPPQQPAFGDFNEFTSAPTSSYTTPSTNAASVVALPEHSRASTGFGDMHSPAKEGTPVNFANLPPIEDGWSSFQ